MLKIPCFSGNARTMGSIASDLKYHQARTEEKPPGGTRCAEILRLQRHSKTEISEFFCSRWEPSVPDAGVGYLEHSLPLCQNDKSGSSAKIKVHFNEAQIYKDGYLKLTGNWSCPVNFLFEVERGGKGTGSFRAAAKMNLNGLCLSSWGSGTGMSWFRAGGLAPHSWLWTWCHQLVTSALQNNLWLLDGGLCWGGWEKDCPTNRCSFTDFSSKFFLKVA